MKSITFHFNDTTERDRYIDENFPERKSDDNTPGFFYVLGGHVSVFCEDVTIDAGVFERLEQESYKQIDEQAREDCLQQLTWIDVNLWPEAAWRVKCEQEKQSGPPMMPWADVKRIDVSSFKRNERFSVFISSFFCTCSPV